MANIFDEGFDAWLRRGESSDPKSDPFNLSGGNSGDILMGSPIAGVDSNPLVQVQPDELASGEIGSLIGFGKKTFIDPTDGWLQGLDSDGQFKWIIGNGTYSIDWNVTVAGALSIAGSSDIDSGTIAGMTISATSLTTTAGGNSTVISSGAIAFSAGPTGLPTVTITQTGVLSATGATISGALTATAGAIGGFDIGTDYVRDVANSFGLASTVTAGDDVRFWAGATFTNRATAPFRVTESGAVTMDSATIAGYVISADWKPALTTYEDITAGNPIKVVNDNGTSKFAKIFGRNGFTQFDSVSSRYARPIGDAIKLSSNKVAVYYQYETGGGVQTTVLRVGTISGSTITWGTKDNSLGITSTYTFPKLVRVSDTCFIAVQTDYSAFSPSRYVPMVTVCTVSGTTITVGSSSDLGYPTYGKIKDALSPADGYIAFALSRYDSGTKALTNDNIVVGSVDEGARTITLGALSQLQATATDKDVAIGLLSSNRVFCVYADTTYRVLTISTTTCTSIGTGTITGAAAGFQFMKAGTSNEGIAFLGSGATKSVVKLVESGGAITASLTLSSTPGFNGDGFDWGGIIGGTTVARPYSLQCYDAYANTWIVRDNNDDFSLVYLLSDQIVIDTPTDFKNGHGSYFGICPYDYQKVVVLETTGSNPFTIADSCQSLDLNVVVGFAETTKSSGQTLNGNILGMLEQSQTGLDVGFDYYLAADNTLTRTTAKTVNGVSITNKKVGKSYSATKLFVNV